MPQVSDNFGPYPLNVTLNGSGAGTVQFQPNGNNVRITNLFVKVATSVRQATCTIYRGQIGDNYIVANTQSGSTGAPASGAIDLYDGEILYIVWSGGDAGAQATATLIGTTIPKDSKGPRSTELHWEQPIAAGDGTLIFPAIKSNNYVAGVSGWMLDRDGNFEANDGEFRGEVLVQNASGSYVSIEPGVDSAVIHLEPPTTPGITYFPAEVYSGTIATGLPSEQPNIFIASPIQTSPPGPDNAFVAIYSQSSDGTQNSFIDVNADDISLSSHAASGRIRVRDTQIEDNVNGLGYFKGLNGTELVTFVSGPNGQQAVVFANSFPTTPMVFCNINNASGAVARWTVQAINVSTTGFTIFAQKGAAADGNSAWTNIPVQWVAIAPII